MNTIMINDRFKDIESRIEKLEKRCNCQPKPNDCRVTANDLNVRVAKALGKEIYYAPDGWRYREYGTSFLPRTADDDGKRVFTFPIPPYDTNVAAAIGALEEYALVKISGSKTGETKWSHLSLLQAVCEAIVKHSEGE